MTKSELRQYYLQKRKDFSEIEINEMSLQILDKLKSMDIWNFETYHLFQSIVHQNEVQTKAILDDLFSQKKTVVVPKVKGLEIKNCKVNQDTEWINGKFNVPEPFECTEVPSHEIDVVFIPLLISDRKGNRIGYGGGFYDRFLAKCPENTLKIGLNFFAPIDEILDVENFDIPLDYCVTPEEIVSFKTW
jgi:5-formyltetrahydrofolate cyclo-ligase